MSNGTDPLAIAERSELRGDLGVATTAYERLVASGEAPVAAEARFRLGRIAWRQGRLDDALTHYSLAAASADEHGLTALRARVENGVGAVHFARGEYPEARASYGAARQLDSANPALLGRVLLNLGAIASIEGDLPAARDAYLESEAALAIAGDDAARAVALHNLGMVSAELEQWEDAAARYASCLQLCERLGNRQMFAHVLLEESGLHCVGGRFDAAIARCDRALAIYAELGDKPGRGSSLRARSRALRLAGRHADAGSDATEALRIAARLRSRLLEAEATRELGLVRLAMGDATAASSLLAGALATFTELGAEREMSAVRAELAGAL